MNKVNYQKQLEDILRRLPEENSGCHDPQAVPVTGKKKLLIHSCCAPCSSYVLEYLSQYFEITDFFYNPNISPKEEYEKREEELERLIGSMPFVHKPKLLKGEYCPEKFYEMARGMEDIPEGHERCFACYQMRMEEAARLAAEGGYDYFTTTLSISPLKNAAKINEIGESLAKKYHVRHLPSDFKKKNGYKRSTELSGEYGLYRQDFCGCVFSKRERDRREAQKS